MASWRPRGRLQTVGRGDRRRTTGSCLGVNDPPCIAEWPTARSGETMNVRRSDESAWRKQSVGSGAHDRLGQQWPVAVLGSTSTPDGVTALHTDGKIVVLPHGGLYTRPSALGVGTARRCGGTRCTRRSCGRGMQPEHRHDMGRDRDQTFKDGEEVVTLQETRFRQQGELMSVETTTPRSRKAAPTPLTCTGYATKRQRPAAGARRS